MGDRFQKYFGGKISRAHDLLEVSRVEREGEVSDGFQVSSSAFELWSHGRKDRIREEDLLSGVC